MKWEIAKIAEQSLIVAALLNSQKFQFNCTTNRGNVPYFPQTQMPTTPLKLEDNFYKTVRRLNHCIQPMYHLEKEQY
jgi:hypothetical protein